MNYLQKNRRTITFIVLGIVLFTALLIWGIRKQEYTPEDISATVYPISLNTGETITFEDKSPFGQTRKWLLGDGFESAERKGQHVFKKPGYYQVTLLIDNKLSRTFPVLVSSGVVEVDTEREPTLIDAPTQAMQLENVLFRAVSSDAKVYTWKFGESGQIDAKEKMATYAFKNPGNYVVTLYTDADAEPLIHQIRVLPAYPALEDEPELAPAGPTESEIHSKINDDFRYHLQQIANGNNFNYHYNYLLTTYLCNKDNVSVSVNDKNNSFYYYCTGLQFDKNNLIQEVTTTVDTFRNCISKVEVKQSKQ